MNPNHTHFILVDDDSEGKFGVEIDFRTSLESEIRTRENVPMVLIVVNGGIGTLKTVAGALEQEIPVILIAVCSIKKFFYCSLKTFFY